MSAPTHCLVSRAARAGALSVGALLLAACISGPKPPAAPERAQAPLHPQSQWVETSWDELPGWDSDPVGQAWGAWMRSCARPAPAFAGICAQAQGLWASSDEDKRRWMRTHLRVLRVQSPDGNAQGLLTGYYEPALHARRTPDARFRIALHAAPASGAPRSAWYTREQIDTLPAAQAALSGRALMYLADPVDAMILHVQGSGRVLVDEADGSTRAVRLAFAGTNQQPYRSPVRWLMDRGDIRSGHWDAVRAWAAQNPARVQAMLWSNPRYVFFREEPLDAQDDSAGPKGAQGVALTPGRSIAVDRASIPYGTPVWLSSSGPTATLQRLVIAQDTGSAIVGAVRADYFAGSDEAASALAHGLKQPLRLWVLWPR